MIGIRSNEDLIRYMNSENFDPEFIFFWGGAKPRDGVSKTCMSQWYPSQFSVSDLSFPTAEHYMMATKAAIHNDEASIGKILKAKHPSDAKRLGRRVKNFDDELWNPKRMDVVVTGNCEKFKQNPELLKYLLSTGNKILVEASPVDRIWGIGMGESNRDINDPSKWKGSNLLGYALMEARDRLRKEFTDEEFTNDDTTLTPKSIKRYKLDALRKAKAPTIPDIEECFPYKPYKSMFT